MKRRFSFLLSALLLAATSFAHAASFAEYDLSADMDRQAVAVEALPYQSWVQDVRSRVNIDPFFLLKRQSEFFKKGWPEEYFFFSRIINKRMGTIRPINALEVFLMKAHAEISPLEHNPFEFSARILKKQEQGREKVKVIFVSTTTAFVSNADVEDSDRRMEELLHQGWTYAADLHNHPFFWDNETGDIAGTLIPSFADRRHYREMARKYGLKEGRITNGLHTISLSNKDFTFFK